MDLHLLASVSWNELPILVFAVLLGLVFALVIRQNQRDYLELVGILADEHEESPLSARQLPPSA
ncbi:hypothetical protein [Candidatus Accumulibacter sp. ACC003]|uniref:hypothetical protein n=1 Tax=Candidatus Accumulibacter sp. ACC003 TaxID=2823334 RepID=UPI0025B909E4|nr:hypothetical protein [Candidatus Accumulibacter sp. ACC003]